MMSGRAQRAVVIDNGSGWIKAGFAGEERPRMVFPAVVGVSKEADATTWVGCQGVSVGDDALAEQDALTIKYPVVNGVVHDWDAMEALWRHVFSELRVDPSECPVLMTEPPLSPKTNRERTAQVLFETFAVPAMYVACTSVLDLYAVGRTTGIVLDIGDGVAHATPIYEGYALDHATKRLGVAGRDLTARMADLLKRDGVPLEDTAAGREIARKVKESVCYVASEFGTAKDSVAPVDYALPDGKTIAVGAPRIACTEVLFNPYSLGLETVGVHEQIRNAIQAVDSDIRRDLYANLVVAGGSSMFPGFPERLAGELAGLVPSTITVDVITPAERKYAAWAGGAILASVSTFDSMWITKTNYSEQGSKVFQQRAV